MAEKSENSCSEETEEKKIIYLDYNATTPLEPRVQEIMKLYLTQHFGFKKIENDLFLCSYFFKGNPSSAHLLGRRAKEGVEKARKQVAELLQVQPEEIIFTSGGTESNNYALKVALFF